MKAKEYVHHGWTVATAFVIDVGLVGEAEAQRRALESYRPGVRLHDIDKDHWLLVLPEPIEIHARSAPGMILVEHQGSLLGAPALQATDGEAEVAFWLAGSVAIASRSKVVEIDPSDWLDVEGLPIARLEPVDLPILVEASETPAPAQPDLRRIAHVRERSVESTQIEAALAAAVPGGRTPAMRRGVGPPPAARQGSGLLGSIGSFLASVVLRSPIGGEVRRRQFRYIERLADQFDRDLDEALRNAIPLGGLGEGGSSLRMPPPRTRLQITGRGLTRTSSVDLGPTVFTSLMTMYRRAAEQLEAAGRLEEAAFTLVELMNDPHEGVAMLERHDRHELAAEIAEVRRMDPSLIVRLWWLAGDRGRAVTIARRHGVFGAVIERLAGDPGTARELRLEWVESLERAGDILGAVAAGWPDAHIRPLLRQTVQLGVGMGGPAGAALHAYRLALQPTDQDLAESRALVATFGPDDSPSLRTFVIALAGVSPDPVVDREFASLSIRASTRNRHPSSDRTYATAFRALRDRADPALRADLPATGGFSRTTGTIKAPRQPAGLVPIRDAAALPNDMTLVALGEAGCRLLRPDGKIAVSWDVSAHRLVVADHGGSALLVSTRGEVHVVVRLDLTTRKTRTYGAIRASHVADTFDGANWAVVDERGIAFHDTVAEAPSIIWRELEPGWTCHRLARDRHQLASLVEIGPSEAAEGRLELWRWTLPGIRLHVRSTIKLETVESLAALLSDATSIWKVAGAGPKLIGPHQVGELGIALPSDDVQVSQSMIGLFRTGEHGSCEALIHRTAAQPEPAVQVPLAADGTGFRAVGDRVAVWDGTGRLVTADIETGRLITATRLLT